MRYLPVVVALVAVACKKDPSTAPGASGPTSTKDNDAMWALAPEGAEFGVVMSPRGLALFEHAVLVGRSWLDKLPDLAPLAAEINRELPFGPTTTLADLGLSADKPAALFMTAEGRVVIIPLEDRDKFLAKTNGTKSDAGDRVGGATCKTIKSVYACAEPAEMLDALGTGPQLAQQLPKAGARGDIEVVTLKPLNFVAVVQLERGAGVVRGVLDNIPPVAATSLGIATKPRIDTKRAAGFAVVDPRPFLSRIPDSSLVGDVTIERLRQTLAGPITVSVPTGSQLAFELQVPLSDPAPATTLIERCTEIPWISTIAKVANRSCRIDVPGAGVPLVLDAWVENNVLHIGTRDVAAGKEVAMTPLGNELATGEWAIVLWGRGTVFGPAAPPMNAVPAEGTTAIRVMSAASEVGLGIRVDGDKLRFVGGLRTIFANSDDVVAKIFAISPQEMVAAGGAQLAANKIAAGAPSSPFASDQAAGYSGLVVGVTLLGIVSALAIPMFMDSMKKPKRSEAELQLNKIGKAAKAYYIANAKFPPESAPITPDKSCCEVNFQGKRKCGPDPANWATDAWRELEFQLDEPHFFRYRYIRVSDHIFTALAVGDLDCDGTEITYTLSGTATNGSPEVQLARPAPNTD